MSGPPRSRPRWRQPRSPGLPSSRARASGGVILLFWFANEVPRLTLPMHLSLNFQQCCKFALQTYNSVVTFPNASDVIRPAAFDLSRAVVLPKWDRAWNRPLRDLAAQP